MAGAYRLSEFMENIRLDICYDGTRYRGWQRLPGEPNTIQGKIETALSRILEEPIEISGSGRTDAGVHALGQVANFRCHSAVDCDKLQNALRKYLPEDIGILRCTHVSERFHARLCAREKTYCYHIWNSDTPCVFRRRYVSQFPEHLDVEKMQKAAEYFLGEHDFSAFCGNARMKKSTVRRIYAFKVARCGNEILLRVTGNGFLQGMVRILSGTLIEVGRGTRSPESISALFGANRAEAGFLAPPQGLFLEEVVY